MELTHYSQPFAGQLIAGDAWSWIVRLEDYAPDTYTLKYFLRGPGTLDLVAVEDPDDPDNARFLVTATGAQTEALQAGLYGWQMCVFDQSTPPNRTELARGTVEIVADIQSQGAGFDPRSWVKVALDAVRAVLQNRASRLEMEYTINGRQLRLMSPKDLLELEGELAARYNVELLRSGQRQGDQNMVNGRFDPFGEGPGVWHG